MKKLAHLNIKYEPKIEIGTRLISTKSLKIELDHLNFQENVFIIFLPQTVNVLHKAICSQFSGTV